MFYLSTEPIDAASLKLVLENPQAGACATFEGWVRNHNDGKSVQLLEYEAFEALAKAEADAILREAAERFEILQAICVHRVGALQIGDLAVWVGVSAAHRDAAFKASRYIIDEVKSRLPIWKKEHYEDGDAVWVNCQQCAHPHAHEKHLEAEYYSRQVSLPQVGFNGQAKLKSSKVLVVGAGGLGVPALQYLAAAGVGTLGICEFDTLEASNLHRQTLYAAADIAQPKARLAAQRLSALNPFVNLRLHEARLTADNAMGLLQEYDLVLDCTDTLEGRFLLSDAAAVTQTPLIQAAVYQFEGQLHLYDPKNPESGCLRCLWPKAPEAGCVNACAEAGVLGAVPGTLGSMQAMEALKYLLGLPTAVSDHLLLLDLLTYDTQRIRRPVLADCFCQHHAGTDQAQPWQKSVDNSVDHAVEITATPAEGKYQWIDIREPFELSGPLNENWMHLPGSQLERMLKTGQFPLSHDTRYILVCERGKRSRYWAEQFRQKGFPQVYSLKGGIRSLSSTLSSVIRNVLQ